jgi:hypothetical protein
VGVDVRPRVLGLASLKEDTRNNLVDLADQLEQLVVREVLEGELALSGVPGVRLAEDGVSITGHDLTTLKGRPHILPDSLVGRVLANLRLHLLEPEENFLVGKAVERASKTVQRGAERKERIRES